MRGVVQQPINYALDDNLRVQTSFEGVESLTRQDQLEACDINNIVRDFISNGRVTVGSSRTPDFGDFMEDRPYDQVLTFIKDAIQAFMELPAKERRQYDDDPEKWVNAQLQAAHDEAEQVRIKEEQEALALEEQTALENARALLDSSE